MGQPTTQKNFGVLHKSETTPGAYFVHIAQWQNRQSGDPRRGPLLVSLPGVQHDHTTPSALPEPGKSYRCALPDTGYAG